MENLAAEGCRDWGGISVAECSVQCDLGADSGFVAIGRPLCLQCIRLSISVVSHLAFASAIYI